MGDVKRQRALRPRGVTDEALPPRGEHPGLLPLAAGVVGVGDGQDALEFREMVEFLKGEGLMVQKIPEQLEIVDQIPRNPAGKILKNDLRDRYID